MTASEQLEAALEAGVPEYLAELRAGPEWAWERTEEGTVFLLLEHLRLWLLDLRDADARERAWATIEQLAPTDDPLLLNGLIVGLLEGHWKRRDRRLMGPRTRALWDEIQAP